MPGPRSGIGEEGTRPWGYGGWPMCTATAVKHNHRTRRKTVDVDALPRDVNKEEEERKM